MFYNYISIIKIINNMIYVIKKDLILGYFYLEIQNLSKSIKI